MKKLTWKHWGFVWIICFEVIISWARYRCYFRWDFLQGKEGVGKNPPPALLSTPTPLLQCHRQLQISPVLQPHGKWIQSWSAPAAAQQNSWAKEQRVLPPAGPTTGTGQGASTLPNDRLCPELHRKHLGKLDRHHLTKGWEQQQFGWHMAQPNKGATATRQLVVLPWGAVAATQSAALTAVAIALSAPFSYTEHKQYNPVQPTELLLESSVLI